MANKILTKSKVDAVGDPSASDATIAELAVNTRSGKLYVGTALGLDGTDNSNLYTSGKNSAERSWIGAPINDTDAFSDASALTLATSESIKAYADTKATDAEAHAYVEANALTLTAALTMGAHLIVPTGYDVQIADAPGSGTDAANKAYVDAEVAAAKQGLYIHDAVVAATTGTLVITAAGAALTITLEDNLDSGGFDWDATSDVLSLDDAVLVADDRVLIKDTLTADSTARNNKDGGIFTVGALTGSTVVLTRASDMNIASEIKSGAFVFVQEGSTNADSGWTMTQDAAITINTTAITWAQFSGAGQIIGGTNLTKVGNTLNVDDAFLKNSAADVMSVSGAGLTLKDMNTTGTSSTGGFLKLQMDDGAATADNMRLGVIEFAAAEDNANNLQTGAKIQAMTDDGWSGTVNDTRLEFYTMDGNAGSELSLTLDSDKLATFEGNVAPAGIVLDGNTITGIDDSSEFTDDDAHIMTSAAIDDRILSYNYGTSSGDLTAIIAGDSLSGTNLDGPIPTINLDPSIALGTDIAAGVLTATNSGTGTNGLAFTIQGSDVSIGGSGDNKVGGAINIIAGHPSGNALGGAIVFKTSPAGATSGTGAGDAAVRTVLTLGSDASATFLGDATISGGDITLGAAAVAGTLTLVDTTAGSVGNTFTLTGSDVTTGSGTVNRAGGALVFDAGTGTGTAVSGSITFKTSAAGATSGYAASDAAVTSVTISGAGNFDGATISGGTF